MARSLSVLGTKVSFAGYPWELLGTLANNRMPWVICYGNRLHLVALWCLGLGCEADTYGLTFCRVTVAEGKLGLLQLMRDGADVVECLTRAGI